MARHRRTVLDPQALAPGRFGRRAAAAFGLAGVRPARWCAHDPGRRRAGRSSRASGDPGSMAGLVRVVGALGTPRVRRGPRAGNRRAALVPADCPGAGQVHIGDRRPPRGHDRDVMHRHRAGMRPGSVRVDGLAAGNRGSEPSHARVRDGRQSELRRGTHRRDRPPRVRADDSARRVAEDACCVRDCAAGAGGGACPHRVSRWSTRPRRRPDRICRVPCVALLSRWLMAGVAVAAVGLDVVVGRPSDLPRRSAGASTSGRRPGRTGGSGPSREPAWAPSS